MEEHRNSEPEARISGNSARELEERNVRDSASGAPRREQERETVSSHLGASQAQPAPSVIDEPAPLSSALGIPTLVNETESPQDSRDGEARPAEDESGAGDTPGVDADRNVYVSSTLGVPLLSDNPTPLSSALHIPTLLNESKPEPQR
jgi:hypothetical protein